jgi:formylglycine-generating enzyme required for sulfatase activity
MVAFAAVVLGACNGLLGIEERGLRPDGGGDDLDGGFDARLPDTGGDDALLDAPPRDAGPDVFDAGPCQTGRGPVMVVTPGACVDSTEVTRVQYKAFLDTNPPTTGQDPRCAWNDSFVPTGGWPPDNTTNTLPVVWVDFCDAVAFCKWSGKHLCGLRDGGAPLPVTSMNPTAEWYYGCTHSGDYTYPYGAKYEAGACNGPDGSALAPVASFKKCEGGYPGLFDMAGNAQEWFNGCGTADAATDDQCLLGGGSYQVPPSCDTIYTAYRAYTFKDLSFRCCASP